MNQIYFNEKLNTIKIFGIGFSTDENDAEIEIKVDNNVIYKGIVKTDKNCNLDNYLLGSNLGDTKIVSWFESSFPNTRNLSIKALKGNFLYTRTTNGFDECIHTYITSNGSTISDPNSQIMLDGNNYDIGKPNDSAGSRGQWCIGIPERSVMTCRLIFTWDAERYGSFEFMDYFFKNLSKFDNPETNNFIKNFSDTFSLLYQTCDEIRNYNVKEFIFKGQYKTVFTVINSNEVLKAYNNRNDLICEKEHYNFLLRKNLEQIITKMTFTNNCCVSEIATPLSHELLNEWGIQVNRKNKKFSSSCSNEWDITNCNSLSLLNHKNIIITNLISDNNPDNFGILNDRVVILDLNELRKDFILNNLETIKLINR
jgi:hypothetical protein